MVPYSKRYVVGVPSGWTLPVSVPVPSWAPDASPVLTVGGAAAAATGQAGSGCGSAPGWGEAGSACWTVPAGSPP